MASFIRHVLAKKVAESLPSSSYSQLWQENVPKIAWCIRARPVGKKSRFGGTQFQLKYDLLRACGLLEGNAAVPVETKVKSNGGILGVSQEEKGITFQLDPQIVTKAVFTNVLEKHSRYGLCSDLYQYTVDSQGQLREEQPNQTVVVEYSSPNIAKRFHAGHLRSTIIGNFLANLHEELGHRVIRINYLGDWGTQFGLLGVGLEDHGSLDDLDTNAMQKLFEIYVKVNKQVASETESELDTTHQRAMDFFQRMEQGEENAIKIWQKCRTVSIEDYIQMYDRLGVHFDVYHGESLYCEKAKDIVDKFRVAGLLKHHENSGVGYIDIDLPGRSDGHANLVKSDGTTLYVTRDISAAMQRYEDYKFHKMYYVVENGQHLHFEQVIQSLQQLGVAWARQPVSDFHIKFGRVEGMSTRRGEVVFLSDILDEAHGRMKETLNEKNTTRVSGEHDLDFVAEQLGVSGILIQDLKERLTNNYKFSWDRMLNFKGDTGVFLQYSHARLCSLEKNCGMEFNPDCDISLLREDQALRLIAHLARFDEAILSAYQDLEPCHLVHYLFMLGRLVNAANEVLQVKGQPRDVAEARLLLFWCSKTTLATGLRILGLHPLDEM